MRIRTNKIVLAVASGIGVLLLAGAPASALLNGKPILDPNPVTPISVAVQTDTSPTDSSTSGSTDPVKAGVTLLQQKAKELLSAKRQNMLEHTQPQRQQACEAHKAELATRANNFAGAAQKQLDTFNSIYAKLRAFYASKQLNVDNYTVLTADATAKQTAAQTAVTALKDLDVSIDCTQPDPAQQVATLKTSVSATRTALQDYRTSLKDLVVAMKGAMTDSDKQAAAGGSQ